METVENSVSAVVRVICTCFFFDGVMSEARDEELKKSELFDGDIDYIPYRRMNIGDICRIELTLSKQEETLSIYQCWVDEVNENLRYSVGGIQRLVSRWVDQDFAPQGPTSLPGIGFAKSLPDAIGRWMIHRYPQFWPAIGITSKESGDA